MKFGAFQRSQGELQQNVKLRSPRSTSNHVDPVGRSPCQVGPAGQPVDVVSEALSVHVVPPAIRIVVVPVGVTVLLGHCDPPRSWTGMVGPSLPGLTITPCVDSLLCYRLIRRPKSIL
jgi:hypothetical protein